MNEPSPLVPQGSFEAQARGKSRVKFAFYTIVVIHVLAIAGFLIIGCKREDADATASTTPTNDMSAPAFGTDPALAAPPTTNTNPPAVATANAPTNIGANTGITATPLAPGTTPATPTSPAVTEPVAATTATEHTIVKGDTFATLATKYHVSVKDIQAANPNLSPTKLKIGDKVKIPAKTATANGSTATLANTTDSTYKVRSGDTLSKIAAAHKTTVKELQRLNNLSTTQIRVGQVLKLPQTAVAPASSPQPAPAQ